MEQQGVPLTPPVGEQIAAQLKQTEEERMPQVGDVVVYHDPTGIPSNALVTAVWGAKCINLVITSQDENKTDPYGRQIERQTSMSHASVNRVHGFYWRWPEEEPNAYVPPVSR